MESAATGFVVYVGTNRTTLEKHVRSTFMDSIVLSRQIVRDTRAPARCLWESADGI